MPRTPYTKTIRRIERIQQAHQDKETATWRKKYSRRPAEAPVAEPELPPTIDPKTAEADPKAPRRKRLAEKAKHKPAKYQKPTTDS